MDTNTGKTQICVALLNEGTDCYVQVDSIMDSEGFYRIVSKNRLDNEIENWEFEYGDKVKCEEKVLSWIQNGSLIEKTVLVAVSKVP